MAAARPEPEPDHRPRRALIWAGSAVPFLLLAALCARLAVDVPFGDEWNSAALIEKSYAGTMTFGDLWSLQNEHRMFFQRVVQVVLAHLTRWDLRWEIALNVLAAAALFLLIAALWRKTRGTAAVLPVFSLLVFSLSQWGNWLTGLQLNVFMSALASAAAIVLLEGGAFAAASLCGIVASYSFASGALAWPAGALLILAADRKRLPAWSLCAAAALGVYFAGYKMPVYSIATAASPLERAAGALCALGLPVCSYSRAGAALCGAAALAVPAPLARGLPRRTAAPWLALGSLSVMAAVLLAAARAEFGPEVFMNSRYATLAVPLWLCDAALLALAAPRRAKAWLAVLAALALANDAYGTLGLVYRGRQMEQLRSALLADSADCVPVRWPSPAELTAAASPLRRRGLSLFARPEQPRGRSEPVDGPFEGEVRRAGLGNGYSAYAGWAAASGGAPRVVSLLAGGLPAANVRPFVPEPGLALRRGRLGALFSGFECVLPDGIAVTGWSADGDASHPLSP